MRINDILSKLYINDLSYMEKTGGRVSTLVQIWYGTSDSPEGMEHDNAAVDKIKSKISQFNQPLSREGGQRLIYNDTNIGGDGVYHHVINVYSHSKENLKAFFKFAEKEGLKFDLGANSIAIEIDSVRPSAISR